MLTETEKHSSTWIKISKELERRLDVYRKKNDNDMTEYETFRLRGQIAEIKSLLKLDS